MPTDASRCRLPPARAASHPGGLFLHRARQVKAVQEEKWSGVGTLVLALTPCYTVEPAREALMKKRIHEGILFQDQYKRYYLYELGVPEYKMLTCTSGCRLEVWLNRAWVSGHVEGDGEDYWLFTDRGGRFLLSEHMKARYIEEHQRRSGVSGISHTCISPSICLILSGRRSEWLGVPELV